jgi:hypothetical protein
MCTIIPEHLKDEPCIAEKDIVVYKSCLKSLKDPRHAISVYRGFRYVKDVANEVEMVFFKDEEYPNDLTCFDDTEFEYLQELTHPIAITSGFHSLIKCNAKRLLEFYKNRYICEFLIPKGAKYFINPCGNVVSNQIIFKKFL